MGNPEPAERSVNYWMLPVVFLPLAVVLQAAVIVAGLPARGQERPNIVVIVADDLGHADLAYRGSPIKTPHRDALAMGGVRLPAFVNWPGRLKPALVKEPLHHVHVMPTLLALVGGRGQADKHPDVVRDLEARLLAFFAATTAAHADVIQLITNGDFSNASPTPDQSASWNNVTSLPGWTVTGGTSGNFSLSGQNTGLYPSQISGTGRGAALNLQNQSGGQPFTYSQTGTVTAAVTSATFSFYTSEYEANTTIWELSSNLQGVLLSGTQANTYNAWTLVSNTLSSGQAASLQAGELLTVSFRTPAGPTPGAVIDNVSLTLITAPEPSTLAGLGVIGTGLAAVIRRRLRTAKSAN